MFIGRQKHYAGGDPDGLSPGVGFGCGRLALFVRWPSGIGETDSVQLGRQRLAAQALVVALDCRSELALALGGGLFIELARAQFSQYACFFNRALEAADSDFKRLIFLDADTRHCLSLG